MKERGILVFFAAILVLSSFASSINLDIKKNPVSDVVISEINEPAIFNFDIRNSGERDYFEIYSLVGVDFSPKGTFEIKSGETKTIEVRAYPESNLRAVPGILNFNYKIRGQNSGIKDDSMTLTISRFQDAVFLSSGAITPDSSAISLYAENRVNHNFENLEARFNSAFFDKDVKFSLLPLEKKQINITIDKAKMRGLTAGQYIFMGNFKLSGFERELTGTINFAEKSMISVQESDKGVIFRENKIDKTNDGNVAASAQIAFSKDIISRLFTRFSQEPSGVERKWFSVKYMWSKELRPGETFEVIARTNYLYPLLMLIAIILLAWLVYAYTSSELVVRKRVSFVRTKGGEFALKVTINVSARKFVEKISIVDRLPGIVKIYERFGTYHPDKIDHEKRRLEWNIHSLQPGEERVFSYIIYSKVGVVGRFELPASLAIYEREGKTKETSSNRAFFMNETRNRED